VKTIHIISFTNPYPPNFGGVIDVFYKIKALKKAGIGIILHVFEYDRTASHELLEYCEKVYYYTRKTGLSSQLSFLPYISYSRRSNQLLENLNKDEYPILFEGLHSCFYLNHPSLKSRLKIVRMHNIEHEYYFHLSKSSRQMFKQAFYFLEGLKLRRFERVLKQANHILAISKKDEEYLEKKFSNTSFVSAFHSNEDVSSIAGKGRFILMHANLEVEENEAAVLHCIRNIFKGLDFPVIIAGKDPGDVIKKEISLHPNLILVENPDDAEMSRLQHDAHIHFCYTFQATGLKLKLLNSLFMGRFVVANPKMLEGSGLDELCITGNTDAELNEILVSLKTKSLIEQDIKKRRLVLQRFSNQENASKILKLLSLKKK